MSIKKDNADGGVGASPKGNTPEGNDWLVAGLLAVIILTIIICAML